MCHLVSCLIGYNDCWISWNISINGSCACNYDNIFYTSVKNFTALHKVIIRLVISINPVSHRHTHPCQSCTAINTSRPRLNGHHFQDDIFRCIFLNENVWISINISLEFVPEGPINNIPAMIQIMAWRRPEDKALSDPMMIKLLTHVCVTRPQWVNERLVTSCRSEMHQLAKLFVYAGWENVLIVDLLLFRLFLFLFILGGGGGSYVCFSHRTFRSSFLTFCIWMLFIMQNFLVFNYHVLSSFLRLSILHVYGFSHI